MVGWSSVVTLLCRRAVFLQFLTPHHSLLSHASSMLFSRAGPVVFEFAVPALWSIMRTTEKVKSEFFGTQRRELGKTPCLSWVIRRSKLIKCIGKNSIPDRRNSMWKVHGLGKMQNITPFCHLLNFPELESNLFDTKGKKKSVPCNHCTQPGLLLQL